MRPISRRNLLKTSVALAGAVEGAAREEGWRGAGHPAGALHLECKFIEKTIDGTRCKLRSYNGKVPGELIKTRPGESLRIRVKNSLPRVDSKGWDGSHNVPHMFDSTNLHLHGLDVIPHLFEPVGTGNPLAEMIDIMPGRSYDYEFKIPDDQPPDWRGITLIITGRQQCRP